MKIAVVYDKSQLYTTGIYCRKALEELGHQVSFYDRHAVVIKPYDLVLKIDDGTFSSFKTMPWHTTAFWAIDTHANMERLCAIAKRAEFLFCAQKNGVELFSQQGFKAVWLPLAGEPSRCSNADEPEFDVAFVGGVNTDKRRRYESLIREITPRLFYGKARQEEIADIYSRAFIGFNTLAGNDINMRTFEVTINGALLLMERAIDNGMNELFEEGKEYIAFENDDDLRAKLKRMLGDKKNFLEIRNNGRKRAISSHTYTVRMQQLMNAVTGRTEPA